MKGITDLSVILYHFNVYYKPSTLQAQRKLENRKRKEYRTENNEAKISVLVERDRRSKRQKSNDKRSNECIICKNKTFRKDSKLYRLCETEGAENCFCLQQSLIWMQLLSKYSSLINLMIYLQLVL